MTVDNPLPGACAFLSLSAPARSFWRARCSRGLPLSDRPLRRVVAPGLGLALWLLSRRGDRALQAGVRSGPRLRHLRGRGRRRRGPRVAARLATGSPAPPPRPPPRAAARPLRGRGGRLSDPPGHALLLQRRGGARRSHRRRQQAAKRPLSAAIYDLPAVRVSLSLRLRRLRRDAERPLSLGRGGCDRCRDRRSLDVHRLRRRAPRPPAHRSRSSGSCQRR